MKVPSHVVGLYQRSVRRYRKLCIRLRKQTDSTGYTYQTLLCKLRKLRRKIAALQVQLKIATASGVLALALHTTPAKAQTTTNNGPFVLQPREENPLRPPFKFENKTYPAIVDLDSDGDFDLVVADQQYDGYGYDRIMAPLRFLLNTGTNASPAFVEQKDAENPFHSLAINGFVRGPVFADIDQDGDPDLFIGIDDATPRIAYYRNDNGTFIEQTSPWDPVAKTGNPFAGISLNYTAKIAFADIDNDDDLDAIITSTFIDDATGEARYLALYKNDGDGIFTEANSDVSFTPMPTNDGLNPALADVDNDGDIDLLLGGYYMQPIYYRQVAPGQFVEETGEYDEVLKTGNPFYYVAGASIQPVFVDLDNDADIDLLVGGANGDHWFPYPNTIIRYFENSGAAVYTEIEDLESALAGVDVKREASPLLVDLDGDGDLDALIGNKYNDYYQAYNSLVQYEFDNEKFHRVRYEDGGEGPFSQVGVPGRILPSMGDLDGDGDLDLISGDSYGLVHYFVNNDGVFAEVSDGSPFADIYLSGKIEAHLKDVDTDGDLDLIVAGQWSGGVEYFENTGTPQVPVFEERMGIDNPFSIIGSVNSFTGSLHVSDIDHDGDLDLIAVEYEYRYNSYNQITYYENTGTASNPVFTVAKDQPFRIENQNTTFNIGYSPKPYLADQDQDGDLDLFLGTYQGIVLYIKNENPTIAATISGGALTFRPGVDEEVVIDPLLTLSDEDDDLIVQATVTITDFEHGEELHFVSPGNISGVFDHSTGVLTLKGKATLAEYQTVLQTVTYHHHNLQSGRRAPRKSVVVAKSFEFRVYDTDFTDPEVASRGLNIIHNAPPILDATTKTTQVGNTVTVDLSQLMSDPDDNIDLSTLRIVQPPSSGATAQIDVNRNLIVNYQGLHFTGVDNLTIEVCDDLGECAQNLITIDVQRSGEIEIYNAVAPNGNGNNAFMRIFNLPAPNKVAIYSRWGDKVFEVDNYDDTIPGKRFEGKSDAGNALSTGTYFYKIEILNAPGYTGPKLLTGYLSLRQ